MEENWDLEAIVRGCTSDFATSIMEDMSSQPCPFVPFDVLQDDLYDFYDCFAKNNMTTSHHHIFNQEQLDLHHHNHNHELLHNPLILNPQQQQQPIDASTNNTTATTTTRRRKNQQKRVVKQVAADDLSSDTWAWRKYGQKPIKGSPYPRSYYRCSSLKGCLARKQVEQSSSDPTMFIISYTAEHSHSHPVRRNSLAGIAKKKSPKNPKTTSDPSTSSLCYSPLSSSTTVFSPTSPLVSGTEHELFLCHESKGDDKIMEEITKTMMSNDVFVSGNEEGTEGETTFDMEGFDSWFNDQIL